MKRNIFLLGASTTLVLTFHAFSRAQETKPPQSGQTTEQDGSTSIVRTTLTPEELSQLINNPGPAHKLLNFMVGEFNVTSKFWPDVKAEPVISKGRARGEWLLDGRYVRTEFEGEMSGRPLKGVGLVGYDGADEQFVNLWMDNSTTRVVIEKGFYDPSVKQFKYENNNNVYDLAKIASRTVVIPREGDNYSVVIYHTYQDTPEHKVLQLDFDRVTSAPKSEEKPGAAAAETPK